MGQNFGLDTLPQRDLEPVEAGTHVVNPVWRALHKELQSLRNKVAHRYRKLAGLSRDKPDEAHKLEFEIGVLDAEIDGLERRAHCSDEHVLAGELPAEHRLEALPESMRLLLDTLRMIACRAETALANVIAPCSHCWNTSTAPRPPIPTRTSVSSTSYCPTRRSPPPAETASRLPNLFHTVPARCKEL